MKGISIDTPLEKYILNGKEVFVKREDLQGDGLLFPRWGKIKAIRNYLEKNVDKNKPITTLSVDGSWSGWVVSAICEELDIQHIYSYPNSKKFNKNILDYVSSIYPTTKLNPIKPNMVSIMFNGLKTRSIENGTQIIPYGFEHNEFISVFIAAGIPSLIAISSFTLSVTFPPASLIFLSSSFCFSNKGARVSPLLTKALKEALAPSNC